MKDDKPIRIESNLNNIHNGHSFDSSDSNQIQANNIFINFDNRREKQRMSQTNLKNSKVINCTSDDDEENFNETNSSLMKSSSTSNLIDNLVGNDNVFDIMVTETPLEQIDSTNEKLIPKISQQLKKDGYLLPIGYDDNSVTTASLSFPFPVPIDNVLVKSRTDISSNESFEDSSASSSSCPKNHFYVNANEVRYEVLCFILFGKQFFYDVMYHLTQKLRFSDFS
jgi:hypothetical protein